MVSYCVDCGKKLTNYRSKRCRKCHAKSQKGENSPTWRGGEWRKKCIDCGKKITRRAIRCRACHNKKVHTGIKRSQKTKEKIGAMRRGKKCNFWKGGVTKNSGYVYKKVYNHPNKNSGGYVAEHRLIMEKYLGRYLKSSEKVHHLNGIRDDNRIENLELCKNHSSHMKKHRLKGGNNKWQKVNIHSG